MKLKEFRKLKKGQRFQHDDLWYERVKIKGDLNNACLVKKSGRLGPAFYFEDDELVWALKKPKAQPQPKPKPRVRKAPSKQVGGPPTGNDWAFPLGPSRCL